MDVLKELKTDKGAILAKYIQDFAAYPEGYDDFNPKYWVEATQSSSGYTTQRIPFDTKEGVTGLLEILFRDWGYDSALITDDLSKNVGVLVKKDKFV